jgi:type II secretory pathway component PulC
MKNFLIALGLLMVIIFIKNLYKDKQFLDEEVKILEFELFEKDNIIKNLNKDIVVLNKKLKEESKKLEKPKKKKIINPKIVVSEPTKVDTLKTEITDTIK